jgi:hypothetical protein
MLKMPVTKALAGRRRRAPRSINHAVKPVANAPGIGPRSLINQALVSCLRLPTAD